MEVSYYISMLCVTDLGKVALITLCVFLQELLGNVTNAGPEDIQLQPLQSYGIYHFQ